MPSLLILNHHSASLQALIDRVAEAGANSVVIEPMELKQYSAQGFDGVIASGGYLSAATYKADLQTYSQFLKDLDRPFLGICLGLKILGYCYGARMRKIVPAVGTYIVRFQREYPLAPGVRECAVYQSHKYELLSPLPGALENYATDGSPVQAVKVRGRERYGLQFHPEMSGSPASQMIKRFVSLCSER
jgi:GMP synthase-like glutamine amidotransferase